MSLGRHEREMMRRFKILQQQGLVPSPPLFSKEDDPIEAAESQQDPMQIPAWRSRKPLADPAVSPPGRSLREIQEALRANDNEEHEHPRRVESPIDFGLGESDKASLLEHAPSPTRPSFRASHTFDSPPSSGYVPSTATNRIPSFPDTDWNQAPLALYFETMSHLVDRHLIYSEIRTGLHSKPAVDGRSPTTCSVPKDVTEAHLAGEGQAIAHRSSAQIAGSIVQRIERMICMDRQRVAQDSAWVHPKPQPKPLREIVADMFHYLEQAKEKRVAAGESPWYVVHELTWAEWIREAVYTGVWHLAGEREECECLGVAVYEAD
ncbi:hypothetical protein BU16DRAFT_596179 [Lophium mytilinum]|uniref:Uncharacterized protein n=1 Tax=Lophium mytilinum TaxID=390894 RepID=A0A6A6QD94_9PEZI|nr:hypothetical protein BU16DRAFT_596179 [Lophium mytilinum]